MFLVWRVVVGEGEWFDSGLKELAKCVNRHEKSIGDAVKSLEIKQMIRIEKNENRKCIKQTLSNDELYTRMTLIDPVFCNSQSIHELREDLNREIERIENEILLTKEINVINNEKDSMIDSIIKQVNDVDFDELISNMKMRTYSNSNKSSNEIIKDALEVFRGEVFAKYGGIIGDFDMDVREDDTYENFWSTGKKLKRTKQ